LGKSGAHVEEAGMCLLVVLNRLNLLEGELRAREAGVGEVGPRELGDARLVKLVLEVLQRFGELCGRS
jgi:hypothetical protein